MKNYSHAGDVVTVVAAADTKSGDLVIAGAFAGVAQFSALSGAELDIKLTGVFDLPKTSGQAWTVGALIYWDATNKVATTTSSGNTVFGKAAGVAANPSATGPVRLSNG